MTPNQAEAVSTALPRRSDESNSDEKDEEWPTIRHRRPRAREVVRLFQCRACSLPYSEPLTLPCGRSICKPCLPETYTRYNITYPAGPERQQGFQCPFAECAREHAIGDCSADVILTKAFQYVKSGIDVGRHAALQSHPRLTTKLETRSARAASGVPLLDVEDEEDSQPVIGGRLVATWTLAENGALRFDDEVVYREPTPPGDDEDEADYAPGESEPFTKAQDATRAEMDCQVCYGLFDDAMTTACGHTFCRACLHRILDHSQYCPVCRRKMAMNPTLNKVLCPSNDSINRIINAFWKEELEQRRALLASDRVERDQDFDIPLFVVTLAFPMMPTFLHVFEPRYKLMMRRALEGDRLFGMVLPKRARSPGEAHFHELGTLLCIVNAQFYPDGRSLIETTGIARFRVLRHGEVDGYAVGKIVRIDDVSIEEEEATEAAEVSPATAVAPDTGDAEMAGEGREGEGQGAGAGAGAGDGASSPEAKVRPPPTTMTDLDAMSTADLMEYASTFVRKMQTDGVPWLTQRMIHIYGECPDDAAVFPWWFASMLPVRDLEKYRLLGTTSVRDRLKICCFWIVEWEQSRW